LLNTGKAAIGKIAFSGREHVVAVVPSDNRRMMAYTLRYQNELRSHQEYFRDIKQTEVDAESLELAESLIAKKSSKFDLSKFQDGYEVAVRELVEAKINHLPIPQDEAPQKSSGKIINLMDALRKSVSSDSIGKPSKKSDEGMKELRGGIGLVKTPTKASKRKSA